MGNAVLSREVDTYRRKHPRVDLKLSAIMIDSPGDLRMLVEVGNLAPGGVFVRAEQSPPVGSEVELGFRMLANRTCTARGHVAWRGESGFGISFDETNEDMERFARQLIALPVHLHSVYLADVLDPELRVSLE